MSVGTAVPSTTRQLSDDEDSCDNDIKKPIKAKRHEIKLPVADADLKLAEKLDKFLKLSETRKPKFLTNKAKSYEVDSESIKRIVYDQTKLQNEGPKTERTSALKSKNFSKEELQDRLVKKYDTLVTDIDPSRPKVNLVKVLSATESVELGKTQARRQLERQLELNSVGANHRANLGFGLERFKFVDGYESSSRPGLKQGADLRTKLKRIQEDFGTEQSPEATVREPSPVHRTIDSIPEVSDDASSDDETTDEDDNDSEISATSSVLDSNADE